MGADGGSCRFITCQHRPPYGSFLKPKRGGFAVWIVGQRKSQIHLVVSTEYDAVRNNNGMMCSTTSGIFDWLTENHACSLGPIGQRSVIL